VKALLIAAAALLALVVTWFWRSRRRAPSLDPRLVRIEQFEAGFMHLIRERYKCLDETVAEVRRCFLDWQMDAVGIPARVTPGVLNHIS